MKVIATFLLPVYCAAVSWAQTGTPHLIVVGIDGLSVDGVVTARTPRLHELMGRSAWTLAARGVMPTLSSPNWASMIDGAGPEQHGITSNGILRKMVEIAPVCRDEDGMFPTVFEAMRAQQPSNRQAIFHDWGGFANLVEKHAPDVMEHVHPAPKTAETAANYWKQNHPSLMFVHLDNVDHTGHAEGWSSASYYRAVEDADSYVGLILDMLDAENALESTYVLISSDHGGRGHGHGKNSLEEIQIPWILSGPGIRPGQLETAVYTYDTAATIAWIFGLDAPSCWVGRPVTAAFLPGINTAHTLQKETAGHNCASELPLVIAVNSHQN
ncbi:MAG TPA: alkaline phosphatase [Bryobacteraceae bacterium]|nr:alkaline phosphatase [Bryobacteraceae bacterium]